MSSAGVRDNLEDNTNAIKFRALHAEPATTRDPDARIIACGGHSSEFAVLAALRWLKQHQEADGSWGPDHRIAMTGLALLSFLAHGETTGSPEFGITIRKGLRYILDQQKDNGWYTAGDDGLETPLMPSRIYEHAVAIYALAEAYGLTGIPVLKASLDKAVPRILDLQQADGGWNFDAEKADDHSSNLWQTALMVCLLRIVDLATTPHQHLVLYESITNGTNAIQHLFDPTELEAFSDDTRITLSSPELLTTAFAVRALQLTGHQKANATKDGMRILNNLIFAWNPDPDAHESEPLEIGRWPWLTWFFISQARYIDQNSRNRNVWIHQLMSSVVATQNPDGSWCPPPISDEDRYGPVYNTALPALMLQIHYRILPSFLPAAPLDKPIQRDDGFNIRFE